MEQEYFDPEPEYGKLKPTVDSCFSNGWNQTWKNFFELLLVVLIVIASTMPTWMFGYWMSDRYIYPAPFYGMFIFFYSIMIIGPVKYGSKYVHLQAAKGDKCDVSGFSEAFKNYLNVIFASLLVNMIVMFGVLFFIIPGIIFACKLAFVPFLVVDRKLDAIEAITTSWNMTHGYGFEIFLIYFLSIPITIAGLLCLIIGIIPAGMWVDVTIASMYHAVSLKRQESTPAEEA